MNPQIKEFFEMLHPECKGMDENEIFTNPKYLADARFITENLDRFSLIVASYGFEKGDFDKVFREMKVSVYFDKIHPDFKQLPKGKQAYLKMDEAIIRDNLDKMEEYMELLRATNGEDYTEEQCIEDALRKTKVDVYFDKAHPDYKDLTLEEKEARTDCIRDRYFIENNIDEVDNCYKTFAGIDGMEDANIIEDALFHAKVETYFDLLHPEYKEKSDEEKLMDYVTPRDRTFIMTNLGLIEAELYPEGRTDLFDDEKTASEKMKVAFDKVKKQKGENERQEAGDDEETR